MKDLLKLMNSNNLLLHFNIYYKTIQIKIEILCKIFKIKVNYI